MNASLTHQPDFSMPLPDAGPDAGNPAEAAPRRSEDFDTRTHNRHLRLAAVLDSCSEQPDFLFFLVGIEKMAEVLSMPESAVERMMMARPGVRLRLAKRVRTHLGLSAHHLEAARHLPDDPEELRKAAHFFAVAIRVAGERRVMPRAAFQALHDRYGVEAVAFGMSKQSLLGPHAEVLAEYRNEEPPSITDLRLFVRSLAALGHAGAAIVALKLGFPVSLATAQVANIDLALETGLPEVALAALTLACDKALEAASAEDAAAWQSDASEDHGSPDDGSGSGASENDDSGRDESGNNASDESPASPDSTEAA